MHKISRSVMLICCLALLPGALPGAVFAAPSRPKPRKIVKKRAVPKRISGKTAPVDVPEVGDDEEDRRGRDEWFAFQRSYPFKTFSAEARRRAWENRPLPKFHPNQGSPLWRSIGPTSLTPLFPNWGLTAGRITSIAVSPADPNIIVIGTSAGGIWRSTNRGQTFAPVSDNHVDLAVGSVAFAPSNPSIVYAGMGEPTGNGYYPGTGVLKSTDAGATWRRSSNASLPSPGRTPKIDVDPNNPERVYLALYSSLNNGVLTAGGFYVSNDGGVTWRVTIRGLVRDFAVHPTNPQILYLSTIRADGQEDASGGVFKSTNAGSTWERVFTSPIPSLRDIVLAVTRAEPERVYAYFGRTAGGATSRLATSTDGGENWAILDTTETVDPGQFGYNTYLRIDPANPAVLYAGARDIFRSTDRGATWTNLTGNFRDFRTYTPFTSKIHPDQHVLTFAPSNASEIYVGHDGGLHRTTDEGNTFQTLNASLTTLDIQGYAIHPTNPRISYAGSQDNGTSRQQPDTAVWQMIGGGDGGRCVVNPANPAMVFITSQYISVDRRVENGTRFEKRVATPPTLEESSTSPRVAFYPPFVGNGRDNALYFGTWRLWISTDNGDSWSSPGGETDLTRGRTSRGTDVLSAVGVSRSNPSVLFTGSMQGRVMVSIDAGANWRETTEGLPDRSVTSLTVNPTNPAVAYVTFSGYGTPHVFRTTDTGATWSTVNGNLPDIPTNTLLIDPLNASTLYVGTDVGIFRSTTAGTAWESFNQGMPPVVVTNLVAQSTGLIHAATYGRGAFELQPDTTPPTVSLQNPSGGEVLSGGANFTINWTSNDNLGVVRHDIALSADGGESFSATVATGLAGDARTFAWTVPQGDTQRARIRVTAFDAAGNQGAATSNDFTVGP